MTESTVVMVDMLLVRHRDCVYRDVHIVTIPSVVVECTRASTKFTCLSESLVDRPHTRT